MQMKGRNNRTWRATRQHELTNHQLASSAPEQRAPISNANVNANVCVCLLAASKAAVGLPHALLWRFGSPEGVAWAAREKHNATRRARRLADWRSSTIHLH